MKFRMQVEYSKGTCVIGNRSLFADVMPVNDVFPARIQEPFSPFVLDKTTETDPLIILTCRDLFFFSFPPLSCFRLCRKEVAYRKIIRSFLSSFRSLDKLFLPKRNYTIDVDDRVSKQKSFR